MAAECLCQASSRSLGLTSLLDPSTESLQLLLSDFMAAEDEEIQRLLVRIIIEICKSSNKEGKSLIERNDNLVKTLITRKCFEVLQTLGEAAINHQAVELCCEELERDERAVKCLCLLSFDGRAKEIAIKNGAIPLLINLLGSYAKAKDESAALALANVLVANDSAKSAAIEQRILDILGSTSLRRLSERKQLCVLKLWQILITHPVGRKYCRQNQGVSGEFRAFVEDEAGKSSLALRSAKGVLELIDWDP